MNIDLNVFVLLFRRQARDVHLPKDKPRRLAQQSRASSLAKTNGYALK